MKVRIRRYNVEKAFELAHFSSTTGVGKSIVMLKAGVLNGIVEFSISHGFGTKELKEWRIVEEDRLALLKLREEEGVKVATTPKSTGRKPAPKRGKKMCKKTVDMFERTK
jgi:hypothetical protein